MCHVLRDDIHCPVNNKRIFIDIRTGYQFFDTCIHKCGHWVGVSHHTTWNTRMKATEFQKHSRITRQNGKNHVKTNFSDLKISRQEKRKHTTQVEDKSPIKNTSKIIRHSCCKKQDTECRVWVFFCVDVSDDLHDTSTFMNDKRVCDWLCT